MGKQTIAKAHWTLVAKMLGAIGLGLMMLIAYFQFHYADVCPNLPDEPTGRVHALNVHGRIVYLNTRERENLYLCEAVALTCGLGFAATVSLALGRKQV